MTGQCDRFGIRRQTGYKWLDRYDAEGVNRTGIVGGPIPREDVAHGPTIKVLPRTP
jgi:hypothetical protein